MSDTYIKSLKISYDPKEPGIWIPECLLPIHNYIKRFTEHRAYLQIADDDNYIESVCVLLLKPELGWDDELLQELRNEEELKLLTKAINERRLKEYLDAKPNREPIDDTKYDIAHIAYHSDGVRVWRFYRQVAYIPWHAADFFWHLDQTLGVAHPDYPTPPYPDPKKP